MVHQSIARAPRSAGAESLAEVLDEWAARPTGLVTGTEDLESLRADLVGAGLLEVLTDHADDQPAVVVLLQRLAGVDLGLGRAAAAHIRAVRAVRRRGVAAHEELVDDTVRSGRGLGWAGSVGAEEPWGVSEPRIAACDTSAALPLGASVLVVDTEQGRRLALVPADGRTVGDPVSDEELLPGAASPKREETDQAAIAHAAISLGAARRLIHAAADRARAAGTPWAGRSYGRLVDDPYVIIRYGRLRAELHAAERLLADTVGGERASRTASAPIARTAAANVLASVAAELPELVGVDSVGDERVWEAARVARTHLLGDSVAWAEAAVGQELLAQPPTERPTQQSTSLGSGSVPVLTTRAEAVAAAYDVAAVLEPEAAERDREQRHPTDELKALGASGLLGITVPTELGGGGQPTSTVAEVVRILGVADASVAQIMEPHFGAIESIRSAGTPGQQRFFFGEAVAGARFGNANGELGTKASGDIRTRLISAPDGGYVVDGEKFYTTGSLSADWIPVTVRDPAGNRASAMVHRDAEGLLVEDDWKAMGQRCTASGTTRLNGVKVAEQYVIASWRAGEGNQVLSAKANIVHGAVNVGVAGGALAATHRYVVTRSRPSKDLGIETVLEDPHVVRRYGRLAARLAVAESALARAADLVDEAVAAGTADSISAATVAAAEAEALGSEVGLEIASELFALAGASACLASHGHDRYWRDVRTHSLHEPMIWKYQQTGDALLTGAYYFGNRRTIF